MSREFACSADNGAFQSLRQWFFIQAEGPRCVCVCVWPAVESCIPHCVAQT